MAVAITKPTPSADCVIGNKRMKVRILTFSGNYATGGTAITPAQVGLKRIEQFLPHGVAVSTDLATSNSLHYDPATAKIVQFESGASGAAAAEKTDTEANATGLHATVTFIGH